MSEIKKITVIGAGVMGHGIAEVCSMAGYQVVMYDIKSEILDSALSKIKWSLDKFVERKKLTEKQRDEIMDRIKTTKNLEEAVKDTDYVLEAVFENVDLKRKVFSELDKAAPKHAILASNTSSIPITILGEATKRPDKVIGSHWFNPPVMQPLIEIIPSEKTSKETIIVSENLARRLGKEPVILKRDLWAFVTTALFEHIMRESCWIVYNGEATPLEVDACARYKLGHPMGPLETIDLGGLDTSHHVEFDVRRKIDSKWIEGPHPDICPLIVDLVKHGKLGMKSGEGFYKYPGPGVYKRVEIPKELAEKVDPARLIASTVSHASYLIRTGVTTRDDLDKMVKLGLGYPKGLFEYADEYGIDNIVNILKLLKQKYGKPWYEPDTLLMQMVEKGCTEIKAKKGFYVHA